MVDPVLEVNGNNAVLKFTPYFKSEVFVQATKTDDQLFRLSYTGLHETVQFVASVKSSDDCGLLVEDVRGRIYNVKRLSSDEQIDVGDTVLVFDHYGILFDIFNDRSGPCLAATKAKITDPRLISVNLDILNGGGEIVVRRRCSPYTGEYIEVKH